jgi:hypothetical protein
MNQKIPPRFLFFLTSGSPESDRVFPAPQAGGLAVSLEPVHERLGVLETPP